jgi:hypothetical protein
MHDIKVFEMCFLHYIHGIALYLIDLIEEMSFIFV